MLSTLSRTAAAVALAAAAVMATASVSAATVTEVSAPVRVHIGAPYQTFLVEVGATDSDLNTVELVDPVKGTISSDDFTEKDDDYWTALPGHVHQVDPVVRQEDVVDRRLGLRRLGPPSRSPGTSSSARTRWSGWPR
jgi:hypothetical protein